MTSRLLKLAAGLAATGLFASGAAAQSIDLSTKPAQEQPAAATAAATQIATSEATPFAADTAASTEALGRATAREDISLVSTSQQTSTVSGNSVNGTSTTGDIGFSDNAFQNASGLTVINANSGNNVSMNASMNVNIVMAPPPAPPQP